MMPAFLRSRPVAAMLAVAAVAALPLLGSGQRPALAAGDGFSDAQRAQIEAIIKDYLVKNPEILMDVQKALDQKMETARNEAMSKALSANSQSLYKDAAAPMGGNAKGNVTVVEFFDYNCGYCRKAIDDVTKLIDSDKNVRVVFKDFPIFGKDSEGAARVAIASKLQGKYFELHKALLTHEGKNTEEAALELAKGLGLDVAKLKKDMASPDVQKELDANHALAEKLGIQGTPHFFIGDKIIPGAPEDLYAELTGLVGDVRKNGCKVC